MKYKQAQTISDIPFLFNCNFIEIIFIQSRQNINLLPQNSKKILRIIFMNVSLFETTLAYISLRNKRLHDETVQPDLYSPT